MPCRSDYMEPTPTEIRAEMKKELDLVTRMLCQVCRQMENERRAVMGELKKWWTEHKAVDERRIALENAASVKAKLRAAALAKLTTEERKVLGV